jgi:leucyl aminopeptidase
VTKITVKTSAPQSESVDLLVQLLHEGEKPAAQLDEAVGKAATASIKLGDFQGKLRQKAVLYPNGGLKAKRLLLVGLGPKAKSDRETIRRAVGTAVQEARKLTAGSLGIAAPKAWPRGINEDEFLATAAEAAVLAGYEFKQHKSGKASPNLKVTLFASKRSPVSAAAAKVGEAVNLARDLANAPGNFGTPSALAAAARKAGRQHGFKVQVLTPTEMKKLGMGGLLGVAKGSDEPARFIVMDYNPKKKAKPGTICLVGKGLTFDAGGISLKPADKMWDMKFDKCGGCAVIGAMAAIAATRLPRRVVGLVPSTENMPSGSANKPGDVLTAMNGKTIEVLNTDAEGRLILADALAYSARFKPEVILDFATLTGACAVALGDVRGAVMSPDDTLAREVQAAGDASGELVWPLPMDDAYGEQVKSEVADVKNLGKGRLAGSIAGGWFLRNFVPENTPWAHLDIAGVAWNTADPGKGYLGKGASGFGVRLAWEFVKARCS